jgi:rare lipoprotein A
MTAQMKSRPFASSTLLAMVVCGSVLSAASGGRAEETRATAWVPLNGVRPPQSGIASWYGSEHAGRPMANGAIYDPNLLTAAHRSFPFGTRLRVTHLANGRSVVVTVTDRGPYVRRRFIDLSQQAAETLGMTKTGLARVRIEVLPSTSSEISQEVKGAVL